MTEPKTEDMTNAELADDVEDVSMHYTETLTTEEVMALREAARRLRAFDDCLETVAWARKRLDDRADRCNAGEIQDGGREWSRSIWAAFSDYDEAVAKLTPPKEQP